MPGTTMTEDDRYRTSTQYRLWSFTEQSLTSLRATTNTTAVEGVRAAVKNLHLQKARSNPEAQNGNPPAEVDCLTVDEEQRLVGYYCLKTMQFADFSNFPTNVKASAVQFMKRFYLSNSPMTYHPKEIMPTALFLASKTENIYMPLKDFASKLPKTTPETVLAPEFLLTQGLRFTFDVRHPYRGLEGGYMELLRLANGQEIEGISSHVGSAQIAQDMMHLEPANNGSRVQGSTGVIQRIEKSKGKAKDVLKTSALLTDAYFFYTPSQIWLSAWFLADEPLIRFYLDAKSFGLSELKSKLLTTIYACADVLRSSPSADPEESEMNELKRIDKKLYMCRNPEKIDLVGINKAQKREGAEEGLDEKVVKKRKLEREKSEKEAEDVFGPAIAAKQR